MNYISYGSIYIIIILIIQRMDRASRLEQAFKNKKNMDREQTSTMSQQLQDARDARGIKRNNRDFSCLNRIAQEHADAAEDRAIYRNFVIDKKRKVSTDDKTDQEFVFNKAVVELDSSKQFPDLGMTAIEPKTETSWGKKSKSELISKMESMKDAPVKKNNYVVDETSNKNSQQYKIHVIENFDEIYNDLLMNPKMKQRQGKSKDSDGFVTISSKDTEHRNYY